MSLKTTDYVLSVNVSVLKNERWDKLVIPAGTFVKPIETTYLPAHIKKGDLFKLFMPATEIYVYCSYGMFPVPKDAIRSVG